MFFFMTHSRRSTALSNHCLATREDDHEWSTFAYWIVVAMVYAEEKGINRENSNDMPTVNSFGTDLRRMFRDAVNTMGNHGDIYMHNMEAYIPRAGLNLLYHENKPALLYPPGMFQ